MSENIIKKMFKKNAGTVVFAYATCKYNCTRVFLIGELYIILIPYKVVNSILIHLPPIQSIPGLSCGSRRYLME